MDDGVALILLALATGGAVIIFALRQNLRQKQVLQEQERALEAKAAGTYLHDLLSEVDPFGRTTGTDFLIGNAAVPIS